MKKLIFILLLTAYGSTLLATSCLLSTPCFAAPNILGPTGLITMPNADVVDARDYNICIGAASWKQYGAVNMSLNGSPVNNLEIGASKYFSSVETPLDLNLKYKIWNYSQSTPFSIALGGGVGFDTPSYAKAYITTTYPSFNKFTPLLPSLALSIDNMNSTTNWHLLMGTEWIIFPNFRMLPEIDLTVNPSFNIGGRVALNKSTRLDFYALLSNNSSYGMQISFNSNPKLLWF